MDVQRADISVKRCSLRNRNQKHDLEKGVFIELGKSCCRSVLAKLMYDACKVMKGGKVQCL